MKTDSPHLSIIQLKKKPKGHPLDAVDRFINPQKSRIRIRVEHAIGGGKRLAAVAQPYRNHTPKMEDQLMLVACGLWNFHLKCTPKKTTRGSVSIDYYHATTLLGLSV
jgi:hypothetical protein